MLFLCPSSSVAGDTFKGPISKITYTVDLYGIVNVASQLDIQGLEAQGFISLPRGRDNLAASTNPGSGNDSSQDFSPGGLWINTAVTPNLAFLCTNASIGAAVWVGISNGTTAGSAAFAALTLTGLLNPSFTGAISAFSGGGQSSATALTTTVNDVTTVAAPGDSVALPSATAGRVCIVRNSAANSMQVFGNGTDTINSVATATGVPQAAKATEFYVCHVAGDWVPLIGGVSPQVAQVTTTATNATGFTLTAAQITGAAIKVFLHLTGNLGAGAAVTLPLMASVIAAIPDVAVGQSYELRMINESAGNFGWTLTNNSWTTFTVPNPLVAQNKHQDLLITVLSATTLKIEAVGNSGTTQP